MTRPKLPVEVQKPDPSRRRRDPELAAAVGARIRQARNRTKVSIDTLSTQTDFDRAHLGRLELGKTSATIETLVRLAQALDVEVGEFFPSLAELRVRHKS